MADTTPMAPDRSNPDRCLAARHNPSMDNTSRVTRASRAARHNPSMDNTTNPRPDLVSNVRDVRRVPLGRLAGRDTDRADAPGIGFNSSI